MFYSRDAVPVSKSFLFLFAISESPEEQTIIDMDLGFLGFSRQAVPPGGRPRDLELPGALRVSVSVSPRDAECGGGERWV